MEKRKGATIRASRLPKEPKEDSVDHVLLPAKAVRDDRPKVVATERMWVRETGQLAYAAGQDVAEEELEFLVGDAEHQAILRGEG